MSQADGCHRVRALLERWVDEELNASERAGVEAHLARCASCRAEARALASVDAALRGMEVPERDAAYWDRVADSVWERRAARGQREGRVTGGRRGWRLSGGWTLPGWRALVPVAALALVVVVGWQAWRGLGALAPDTALRVPAAERGAERQTEPDTKRPAEQAAGSKAPAPAGEPSAIETMPRGAMTPQVPASSHVTASDQDVELKSGDKRQPRLGMDLAAKPPAPPAAARLEEPGTWGAVRSRYDGEGGQAAAAAPAEAPAAPGEPLPAAKRGAALAMARPDTAAAQRLVGMASEIVPRSGGETFRIELAPLSVQLPPVGDLPPSAARCRALLLAGRLAAARRELQTLHEEIEGADAESAARVRPIADYLGLVLTAAEGRSDTSLEGLRERRAATARVAATWRGDPLGRRAALWSAEIACRITQTSPTPADCEAARAAIAEARRQPPRDDGVVEHLDRLEAMLDGC
ncbi:MAG: zf-HC2 domain-containing protein [Candidatus Eiseniibacteriota bacterium]|jgi:hypothetical protein